MSRPPSVADACAALIAAVYLAKSESSDQYALYDHRAVRKAYTALWSAVQHHLAPHEPSVRWHQDVSWLVPQFVDRAFSATVAEKDDVIRGFTDEVRRRLNEIAGSEWLALLPLERRFAGFADYVPLDGTGLGIMNPMAGKCGDEDLCDRAMDILRREKGVTFVEAPVLENALRRKCGAILHESCGMIPAYPQLVVPIGKLGINDAWSAVAGAASRYLPLVGCAVLLYDYCVAGEGALCLPPEDDKAAPMANRPVGELARPLYPYGLGLQVRTGDARLFAVTESDWERLGRGIDSREWHVGDQITQSDFLTYWRASAGLLLRLRQSHETIALKIAQTIERALRLVGKCKYARVHQLNDVVLTSVIATETLLNPFDVRGGGGREWFALFSSALASRREGQRGKWYKLAVEMYGYRNYAAHQACSVDEGRATTFGAQQAVRLLHLCLMSIHEWIGTRLTEGKPVDRSAFCDLYQECVLG